MEFIDVCDLEEIKSNGRKIVDVKDEKVVLFYLESKVYAINAVCPHKCGPLGDGELHQEEITCPWHGYMFNIKDGSCLNHPGCKVKTFKVKVENNLVKVGV